MNKCDDYVAYPSEIGPYCKFKKTVDFSCENCERKDNNDIIHKVKLFNDVQGTDLIGTIEMKDFKDKSAIVTVIRRKLTVNKFIEVESNYVRSSEVKAFNVLKVNAVDDNNFKQVIRYDQT